MLKQIILIPLAVLATLYVVDACNSAVCGPTVSKCMLINCCNCDMSDAGNCSCCVDCALCLSKLYTECCSCVGLCPVPDPSESQERSSTIEDLRDPIPGLFNALTEEEDYMSRWSTFTYAIDLDKLVFEDAGHTKPNMEVKIVRADHSQQKGMPTISSSPPTPHHAVKEPVLGIRNCTVAFFSDCLSMSKCKDSCTSMGAAKYRWFHQHGCCQCVGSSCYDYGLSQPHCLKCLENEESEHAEGNLYVQSDWRADKHHKRNHHKHHHKHHNHKAHHFDSPIDTF